MLLILTFPGIAVVSTGWFSVIADMPALQVFRLLTTISVLFTGYLLNPFVPLFGDLWPNYASVWVVYKGTLSGTPTRALFVKEHLVGHQPGLVFARYVVTLCES